MTVMTVLSVDNIVCSYGQKTIFQDLSFSIEDGSGACLLGPSGCGKTTALRAIAGFEPISDGSIHLKDRLLSSKDLMIPTEKRKVGMVFQSYALFPHMSNYENVAFGLRHLSKSEREHVTLDMLELVGLKDAAQAWPRELSGGEQQRIALARALAPSPDLLLLDEPFSNLDTELRQRLNIEVKRILHERNVAYLLVTHDQHEAFAMADQIGVMNDGCIQQWDTPFNIYHQPVNTFVANFVGEGSLVDGLMSEEQCVSTVLGNICGKLSTTPMEKGSRVKVLLRPDDIVPDPASSLIATVTEKAFKGASTLYHLRLEDGSTVKSLFTSHNDHEMGTEVGIRIDANHLVVFPAG